MSEMGGEMMSRASKMDALEAIDEYVVSDGSTETTNEGVSMTRRGMLGAMAGIGAAMVSGSAMAKDHDPKEYIAQTKKMIEAWYAQNKESIYKAAVSLQQSKDKTGKDPEKFVQQIPVPKSASATYSGAKMEISYNGDKGGNPTYKVQFYVTETNKDIDSGSKILTLTKKK